MVRTIGSRPNHYETLGLRPTASDDEIARAFVREAGMFRPRALGGFAEVSVAYETLRNPARRRAYDASLGLGREAQPRPAPTTWRVGAQFTAVSPRPVHDRLPPAPPSPPSRPEAPAEPRIAPFIATSVRDVAAPTIPRPSESKGGREIDPEIRRILRNPDLRLGDAEDRPIEWTRTFSIVGVLVVAVIFLGALAGWQAGKEPQQYESAVTTNLPAPKRVGRTASPPAQPAIAETNVQPQPVPRAAAARIKAVPIPRRPAASEEAKAETSQTDVVQTADSQPEGSAAEQAAVEPAPVETAAALPLSNGMIARTIERIGYACGRVTSASAIGGGSSGVYKVNCASGQSYQATPVNGRYHFRRLGSH